MCVLGAIPLLGRLALSYVFVRLLRRVICKKTVSLTQSDACFENELPMLPSQLVVLLFLNERMATSIHCHTVPVQVAFLHSKFSLGCQLFLHS